MLSSGIYCIENLKNGKRYIGQAINLRTRKCLHFSYLRSNTHDNPHLQNAFNKYGEGAFVFKIILYCEPFELTRYEQSIIDKSNYNTIYNIRLECCNSNLGIRHKPETIEFLREINSGKNNPMYGRKGTENPRFGLKHTAETRKKMSKNNPHLSGDKSPILGEKNLQAKLTEEKVYSILDLYYNKKEYQKDIAKYFSVSIMAISKLVRGKTWNKQFISFMRRNNPYGD